MLLTIDALTNEMIDQLRNEAIDADDTRIADACSIALEARGSALAVERSRELVTKHLNAIVAITPKMLRGWKACWKDDRLAAYMNGRAFFTARDLAEDESVTHSDRMWGLTNALARGADRWKVFDFALWNAESTLANLNDEWRPKIDAVLALVRPLRGCAESAAESARSAARSAAWSAARSAARSAESAAETARSAAWSAAWSAESAAETARSAAESAESARSAARSAAESARSAAVEILER